MHHIKGWVNKLFLLIALYFLSFSSCLADSDAIITKIDFKEGNRLEISSSKEVFFKTFTLKNPDRLVIDIQKSSLQDKNYKPLNLPPFISFFRSGNNDGYLRCVFGINQKIHIEKAIFTKGQNKKSGKIIVDISTSLNSSNSIKENSKAAISNEEGAIAKTTKIVNSDGSVKYVVKKTTIKTRKNPIIVIDAGHGGKDPGTIGGFARTKEKNITLSYAKELAKQLMNTKRYTVYLTRDNDYFIPLKKRIEKARKIKSDIFISLHANAAADESVSGFSIYTLSETSSDKQAELLAQKENRSDIIAGADFSGASADIMKTLIDLSQRESKNSSSHFANIAIKSIQNSEIKILQNTHRFAGFAVLTAPDMASTLIELGYLSNKQEEKKLNSLIYKRMVAESLVKAIDEYFLKYNSL